MPVRLNRIRTSVGHRRPSARGWAAICLGLALAAGARSQDGSESVSDIQRLLQAGAAAQALQRIDAALAKHPDDAPMKFRRGVALSILGRETEAVVLFKTLAEEHPEIPASYNNLAVLYGRQGDFQKAREALEKATRAYPNYGAAYANLGDVYTQLATQAYSRAIELDAPDASLPDRLARLQAVLSQAGPTVAGKSLKTPGMRATSMATPATTAASTASAVAAGAGDVEAAVAAWAAAWSRRDMDAYVAAYTEDFAGSARSHEAWVQDRSARIVARKRIVVEITALQVEVHGDRAIARFRQTYRSDNASETGGKTLKLVHRDGRRWLIEQEIAG